MPNLAWNIKTWTEKYDWEKEGEEWSVAWGTSDAQWFASLYPRLHHFLPSKNILEIAPGRGRWTKFLLSHATNSFRAVDIDHENIDVCSKKFTKLHKNFLAVKNDGLDLSSIADRRFDFVFSFDSLVHCDVTVLSSYIKQILSSLLTRDGVCFLHHSNLHYSMEQFGKPLSTHARDPHVDFEIVKEIVIKNGGKILCQEIISWGDPAMPDWPETVCGDALTLFTTKKSAILPSTVPLIINKGFITTEATNIKETISNYSFQRDKHVAIIDNTPNLVGIIKKWLGVQKFK